MTHSILVSNWPCGPATTAKLPNVNCYFFPCRWLCFLDLVGYIRGIYDVNDGPTDKDLDDSMLSIINIQFVYDLNAEQVS